MPDPSRPMARSLTLTAALLVVAFSLAAYTLHRERQLIQLETNAHVR